MTNGLLRRAMALLSLPLALLTLALPLVSPARLASARAEGEEAILMRYSWKAGESIRYRMTQASVSRMKGFVGGKGEAETQQTQTSTVRIEIIAVDDTGAADARWIIESNRLEVRQVGGESLVIDSEVPADPNDVGFAVTTAIVGRPIAFHVTASGAVSAVSGAAPIAKALLERFKDAPGVEQLRQTLDAGLSDEAMRDQIERTLNNLPERAVKIGDEWDRPSELNAPIIGPIRSDERIRFVAIHDNAVIDGAGGVGGAGDAGGRHAEIRASATHTALAPDEKAPAKLLSSKSTSEILFDLTRSRLLRYRIESNMDLSAVIPPENGGGTLSAQVTTTTSLNLINEPAAAKSE